MAFLDRFRREKDGEDAQDNENDSSVYIEEDESRNRLASFLFGFFALLVTILIAAGLFFGIRALYRASHHNKNENTASSSSSSKTGNSSNAKNTKTTGSTGSSSSQSGSTGSSSQPSSTPSTGDNLPSTGDNMTLPKTGDPGM